MFLEVSSSAEASDSLTRRNSSHLAPESNGSKNSEAECAATDNKEEHSNSDVEKIHVVHVDKNDKTKKKKAINFFRAFLIPGVIVVRICNVLYL